MRAVVVWMFSAHALACGACRSEPSSSTLPPTSRSSMTPSDKPTPQSSTGSAPVPVLASAPPSSGSTVASEPLRPPPFTTVTKLTLQRDQGGPAALRCKGVTLEIVIDLVAGSWTHAVCPVGADALAIRRGNLAAAQRAKVESAYAAIVVDPVSEGGKDGGTTSLTLAAGDGGVIRYVDRNWRAERPPPPAFRDHRVFVEAIVGALPPLP